MLETEKVSIRWVGANRKYYESQGYKILRISAHKGLPSKEELSKAINDLVTNSYRFKEINLDV